MPTAKKRINVSLSKDTALFLRRISLRDEVPQATKAAELIEKALEIEEDEFFARVADVRAAEKKARWVSHERFWTKVL